MSVMSVKAIRSVTKCGSNYRNLFIIFLICVYIFVQETETVNNTDGNWTLTVAGDKAVYSISSLNDAIPQQISREKCKPVSVACDARNEVIFWTNAERLNESVAAFSNGSIHSVVDTGLSLPEGIAYDWIGRNIYIVDGGALVTSKRAEIIVCDIGINLCSVLVKLTNRAKPREIALHPNKGLMFWTDWGLEPAIMRAGMDGSLPYAVISTNLKWPNGICIDFTLDGNPSEESIFWIDASLDRIETAALDESRRRTVANIKASHPFGIDVFGDRLFWSDRTSNSIKSVNKFTGLESKTHAHDVCLGRYGGCPRGLVICDTAKQPITSINPCGRGTSGCSHICVLSPMLSASCICPVGMILDGDMRTCVESPTAFKLFVSIENTIKFLRLGSIGINGWEIIDVEELESITALVYNPIEGTVIVSDRILKRIYEYNLAQKKLTCLVNDSVGVVADMDIDVVGENLYWVDSEKGTLEMMSLQTRARLVLATDIDNPVDILVVNVHWFFPCHSCIFVSTFGKAGGIIHKFLLNGSNHTEFLTAPKAKPIALHYSKNIGSGMSTLSWIDGLSGAVGLASVFANGTIIQRDAKNEIKLDGPFSDADFHESEIYYWDSCSGEVNLRSSRTYNSHSNPISTCSDMGHISSDMGHIRLSVFNKNMDSNLLMEKHDCSRRNGDRQNCSHICLPTGDGTAGECRCPNGLILSEDLATCELDTPPTCSPSQFSCRDGRCIRRSFVCDGRPDCNGEEDEEAYLCAGVKIAQIEVTTTS